MKRKAIAAGVAVLAGAFILAFGLGMSIMAYDSWEDATNEASGKLESDQNTRDAAFYDAWHEGRVLLLAITVQAVGGVIVLIGLVMLAYFMLPGVVKIVLPAAVGEEGNPGKN